MRTVTALALAALCFLAASHPASALECDEMMTGFHDNDVKSQAWQDIAHGNVQAVRDAIQDDPCYAVMRAGDGRGPLFWAHEFYSQEIIDVLTHHGADLGARDRGGKRPDQMVRAPPMTFEAPVDDEEEYEYEPEEETTTTTCTPLRAPTTRCKTTRAIYYTQSTSANPNRS